MEFLNFLGIFAIIWFIILAFLVATAMHFASYLKWKINKWVVGGITAATWILISWIVVVTVN